MLYPTLFILRTGLNYQLTLKIRNLDYADDVMSNERGCDKDKEAEVVSNMTEPFLKIFIET
jgi:hypothetical protein